MKNTIIFEDKYKVDIKDFSTTEEIDEFVEKREGKKLEIVILGQEIIRNRGDVFPLLDMDIDATLDKAIKKPVKK